MSLKSRFLSSLRLACAILVWSLLASNDARGWGIHVHFSRPHISIPHVTIGPVAITPIGPVPAAAVKPAQNVVNAAGGAVVAAIGGAANVAGAVATPAVQVVDIMAGKESLSAAALNTLKGPGVTVDAVGRAVADTNAAVISVPIVAAQSIAGDVGKTTMTIGTGSGRLVVDFASTAAIEAGRVMQGQNPEMLIAEPLAAAIRSAEYQFEAQSQPIPDDVKARLASAYPAEVIAAARWSVGSISISLPDAVNKERKVFSDVDNAVTVGHITVFEKDPGNNYHWWAHEMQHQVQFKEWGIDKFAFTYLTSCHSVEMEAEVKAQQVYPVQFPMQLMC